ncbi:MAG: signal peptidase II [Verrucomicrobiota bacterium]
MSDPTIAAEAHPSVGRAATIATVVLLLDQATKALVVNAWRPNSQGVEVIPGFFRLVHFRNRGGAWGMLSEYPWGLTIFSIIAIFFIVLRYRHLVEGSMLRSLFLALIFGGILGNLADRLLRGAVVDFLYFSLGKYNWPAFNVADSAICIGVFGFILASLSEPQDDAPNEDAAGKPVKGGTD